MDKLKKQILELCKNGNIQGDMHITKIIGLVHHMPVNKDNEGEEVVDHILAYEKYVREEHKDVVHYYMESNTISMCNLNILLQDLKTSVSSDGTRKPIQIIFPLLYVFIEMKDLQKVFEI